MAQYNILIKSPNSGMPYYRIYQENGQNFVAEDLDTLTTKYRELLETHKKNELYPTHFLEPEVSIVLTEG